MCTLSSYKKGIYTYVKLAFPYIKQTFLRLMVKTYENDVSWHKHMNTVFFFVVVVFVKKKKRKKKRNTVSKVSEGGFHHHYENTPIQIY